MKNSFVKNYTNNKVIGSILTICLLILLVGFSYAFFVYNKTGLYTHTITGGKMSIIYNETTGNNITINNAYPLTDKEAEAKGLEFEFTISGYNESEKNIYYAIEMDYGEDVENKERFKDSDLKLSLYENNKKIFENEIFNNLDNNDIYYGYIDQGTNSTTPTINNYKLRIWINDDVFITDTPDMVNIEGKSVYSTSEYANRYANFKVNVKADLTYDDFGYVTYDANGGSNPPSKTSVLTGMVTRNSPYNVTTVNGQTVYNACIGWSSDPNATVPEYEKGDYYNGDGELLYAVYSSDINVMSNLSKFSSYRGYITEIYFINDTEENIDTRYNAASIKYDLSVQGKVLGWLEEDYLDEETSTQYYKLYIGSDGITYLSTGYYLFNSLNYSFGPIFKNLTTIDLNYIDTSMVTEMSNMFYECRSIMELDVSNFDTSNVTNMKRMFCYCESLTDLNVSNFNTSQVTDMTSMFSSCSSLTSLDVSNFNTSQVADMSDMFRSCASLKSAGPDSKYSLNIKSLDTSKVTNMSLMFHRCSGLTTLDVSNLDTSQVTDMSAMFAGCSGLTSLDLRPLVTDSVTDMSSMFSGCSGLTSLDLTPLITTEITNMERMFEGCSSLTFLDLAPLVTTNVTNMSYMFYGCSGLISIDLTPLVTTSVTDMSNMFRECINLTTLYCNDDWNMGAVTLSGLMFYGCSKLVGAVSYSSSKTDITMANPDTGYFTRKTV